MAAEGGVVNRAFMHIAAGYKSVPGLVVRAIIATLLGTGDLASDVYSTVTLFSLGHAGPANAIVAMVCVSIAVQVSGPERPIGKRKRCLAACVAGRCHHGPWT
jgi:ABC-type dipeptide/oligopeptide/nickel transport system permease subunit